MGELGGRGLRWEAGGRKSTAVGIEIAANAEGERIRLAVMLYEEL